MWNQRVSQRSTRTLGRVLLVLLILSPAAFAQATSTATIVGTVKDSSDAVVPGVAISITNLQTQLLQTAMTDDQGSYRLPLLPIGTYRLEAVKEGFNRYVHSDLTLLVNDYLTINVTLQVGSPTESVTVQATAPLLETQTGTLRGVVDNQRMLELPLQGRNMVELLGIQAGVIPLGGSEGEGWRYSVSGSRQSGVYYLMDAGYNTDTYRNQSGLFPNPDAVQEFSLQRANFSAEYGNATGAVVNVVTKSGTNQVRGSVFEFIRNAAFNARNFFAAQRDSLKRHQYGGTAGGPVLKDRLFFFGSYQGTILRSDPRLNVLFLPTAAMRKGDFSGIRKQLIDPANGQPFPQNQIPLGRFNAVTTAWLPYIKDPGTPDGQMLSGLPSKTGNKELMGRLDFLRGSQRLTAKYFRSNTQTPAVSDPENLALSQGRLSRYLYNQLSLNHLHTFSPTLINNATFAYRWRQTLLDPTGFKFPMDWAKAGIKNFVFHPPEYVLSVTGYFSGQSGHYYLKDDADLHWADSVTYIRGKHEIKFGGEVIRTTNDIRNHYRTPGLFTFDGSASGDAMADFMLGNVYRFLQGGGEYKDLYGNRYGLFVQDNIRLRPELTVNLGLRWDPMFPFQDDLGRMQCFVPGVQSTRFPNAPLGYLSAGDPGCPGGGFPSYQRSFGPRVGFAWRTPDSKWVVRGASGIFWNPQFTVLLNDFVNSAPFSPQVELYGIKADNPYAATVNPFPTSFAPFLPSADSKFNVPLGEFCSFSRDYRPSYTQTFNLTIEREFASNLVARASYVGNLGRQLSYSEDVNYARYIPGKSTTQNMQERRPYKDFNRILTGFPGSTSSYYGLQLSVERRMSGSLSFEANYTWAKVIDEFSVDAVPSEGRVAIPENRKANRGLADFDYPHRFVASYVWSLPRLAGKSAIVRRVLGEWQSSGILTLQSGSPFSVRSGRDNAYSGINLDFADLVGNPYLDTGRPRGELITQYFNTAAFRTNAVGTFGTAPRNLLRGPGSFGFDTSVMKTFDAGERFKIQLRVELFNAFNKPNLGNPYATYSSSSRFGRIESAGNPRIMQLALKLSF